ncbi:hypothetical protein [Bdellovibrio sp.]|uniref:hypothetical protein n=1 Tax=Bdellovibrio TaxID=958 RepID=UPI003221E120
MIIFSGTLSFEDRLVRGLGITACLAALILLEGCSMEASIDSITKEVTAVFSKASVTEVTSGSSQNSYTTRGYKIQASVSYQDSRPEGKTSRGNKVYTNIQGTIFKE